MEPARKPGPNNAFPGLILLQPPPTISSHLQVVPLKGEGWHEGVLLFKGELGFTLGGAMKILGLQSLLSGKPRGTDTDMLGWALEASPPAAYHSFLTTYLRGSTSWALLFIAGNSHILSSLSPQLT